MRRVALAHPGMAAYLLEQGSAGPASVAFTERVAARMAALGFEDQELAHAYDFFVIVSPSHSQDRPVRRPRRGRGDAPALRRSRPSRPSGASARHRHTRDLRTMMDDPAEPFGWSLTLVLEALVARGAAGSS
jgi:hypothetical protein